jgi:DNA-binding transcriptional MerR regulator/methylmalonyl-CoA mutase cobalamin-binding subunit
MLNPGRLLDSSGLAAPQFEIIQYLDKTCSILYNLCEKADDLSAWPVPIREPTVAATDRTKTFNLKAVVRETGFKPDTLRAWERRYGLPEPTRTPGGHRLYSQRDIDTLKWLVARQDEGLSISRAVALWRQLGAEGRDPLLEPAYALPESTAAPAFIPEGGAIADLREAWLAACMAFDESKAERILTYALALFPADAVCLEILAKGLAETGEGWYRGEVTVQQEHFTSELSMRRVETLVAATPAPTRSGRILIGCAPEDQHAFPPLLLAFLLKQRGWEIVYLGARVPAARMETTVAAVEPHLVILTAQHLSAAATLLEAARLLQRNKVPFAFGGRIFNRIPALRCRIPAHFLGERLESASQIAEQLLTGYPPLPPTEAVLEGYRLALAHFRERQALLEADTWRRLAGTKIQPDHITIASEALGKNIRAALVLGDMRFLCTDIEWVAGLLENHGIPTELLRQYLDAYLQAAVSHLDERGNPVKNWLEQLHQNDIE